MTSQRQQPCLQLTQLTANTSHVTPSGGGVALFCNDGDDGDDDDDYDDDDRDDDDDDMMT